MCLILAFVPKEHAAEVKVQACIQPQNMLVLKYHHKSPHPNSGHLDKQLNPFLHNNAVVKTLWHVDLKIR